MEPGTRTTEYSCARTQAWNQRTCGLTAGWLTQGLDEASMGKASRTKVDSSRREKIAAQRVAARRAEQRRRILIASGSVLVVLAIVVAFVVIKLNTKPAADNSPNGPTGAALASVVSNVTSVPASTLDTVRDRQRRGHGHAHDHQRLGPDRQRQARSAVHGRRVLPLLRG